MSSVSAPPSTARPGPGVDPGLAPSLSPGLGRAVWVVLAVLAVFVPAVDSTRAWGWDESMHAELPAVHMLLAAQDGDWTGAARVAVECHQYPFGYPLMLAAAQAVFGISEAVCRATGRVMWGALALAVFLVVREVVGRRGRPARGDEIAPWLGLGLVLASPLTMAFAGTLFLEIPVATAATLAVWLWLRRQNSSRGFAAQVICGCAVAAVFFTKFNYGGLFLAGLALAFLLEAVERLRVGEVRRLLRDAVGLGLVPALAGAWWFLWPWPAGAEVAAVHRQAILDLVTANRELASLGWGYRLLHWTSYLCVSPRAFVVVLIGVLVAARELLRPGGRSVWLIALALVVPIVGHSFHQERFLIPPGAFVFALAALGLARLLPTSRSGRVAAIVGLVAFVGVMPSFDARALAERLPRDATVLHSSGARFSAADPDEGGAPTLQAPQDPFREGVWTWTSEIVVCGAAQSENNGAKKLLRATPGKLVFDGTVSSVVDEAPGALVALRPVSVLPSFRGPERDYVESVVRGYSDLAPGRPLQTAGLERATHDHFLDLLAAALGPGERLGWIGISSELSPAALHVGLLERSARADEATARARFRINALPNKGGMMIAFANEDPAWSPERLAEFATGFDAIAYTEPIDVKARAARRAFMPRYRDMLLQSGWTSRELGRVPVDIPLKDPIEVQLFLARPPREVR